MHLLFMCIRTHQRLASHHHSWMANQVRIGGFGWILASLFVNSPSGSCKYGTIRK
ncbi:hypothetical protein M8C21_021391 [Ambrosia artemisiifolia]|uniref:Uncharacterized protein n=1 Tax=Ambrosia artemisiifolia TaxID=4212 RepID=A0AAD5GV98_AMBAR|nr:hypothetical protein M8C21_021391 [Ambrosia artemisiifolia]